MKRLLPLVVVVGLLTSCVSKSTFEGLQGQLEECKKDKQIAQQAIQTCQQQYDQESARWEDLGSAMSEVLPQALEDFEVERRRIVEMVPAQVQEEVDGYLDEFAEAVSKSFAAMRQDNQRLLREVQTNRAQLAEVGLRTEAIDEKVGARLMAADTARDRMVDEAKRLIGQIQEWDRAYVNEKASKKRLGLNRKERETITLFHDVLVADLNTLATESMTPSATADQEEPSEEAAFEEGAEG